jgi:uncharacterized protein YbjT (DUF2867 family)
MKVLFIGASGMLGKPVARELIKAGFEVTLLARDINKMQQLFPGAKVLQGDVFDVESLKKAFAGQDIVYMNLSVAQSSKKNYPQPEGEGLQNVIAVAGPAGIKRLGLLSSLVKNYESMDGFNWWPFGIKHKAVAAVKSSGMAYSIFYPSTFFESLSHQMKQGSKLMLAGKSEMPMWFIAAEDYGKQVAKAFAIAGDKNQEYAIQGLEALTFDEAAKLFVENYKDPIKIMKTPIGLMKFLGIFSRKMNYVANICDAMNKYPEKFESEQTWKELGKPEVTLLNYIKSL